MNMDLVIKQNTNQQENGNSALLDLLYNLTKPDPITGQAVVNNAILVGRISVPSAYEDAVNFLNTRFSVEQDNGSDFHITADYYYIRFADEEVVRVLLANNIGDGAGVTVQDAAATNLGTIFKNNTTIESFNELQYFSKVLSASAFYGCSSLESVILSDSQTILDRSVFQRTALTSIDIPVGYTTIRQNCFNSCSRLTRISIPSTLDRSEDYVFDHCDALDRVDITDLDAWCGITFTKNNANPLYFAKHLYLNNTLVTTVDLTNITELKQYVFINLESLTSITNFSGLTAIKDSAFRDCTNLVIPDLNLPNLGSIDVNAFYGTKIKVISDLGHITELKWGTFQSCTSLTTVTLPNGLTTIAGNAFYGCSSLSTVNLPSSVTTIGADGFGTNSITTVNITDLDAWTNIDFNLGGSTPIKDNTQLLLNGNPVTTYSFPNDRTTIKKYCFFKVKSLTSITVPNSVTSIGSCAFYGCNGLTSITIPNSVTSIEGSAFFACSSLATITLNEGLTSIGNSSFQDTAIDAITLPSTLTSLGNAFVGCRQLQSIVIPNGCALLSERTFQACEKMTSVTLPNDLTSIPNYTFYMCYKLNNVVIPSSVTSIGQEAFRDCSSLTSITIQGTLTSIGSRAFQGCKFTTAPNLGNITTLSYECFGSCQQMTSITIPNTVTKIENNVFLNCSSLNNVVVPSSVTTIGANVWYKCSSMISLTFESTTPPTIGSPMIYGPTAGLVIYVPAQSVDAYKTATNWATYADRIQAIPTT